jgi:hypothetical protein
VEHPKDIGDRSTLAIILALREAGYRVLLPFGENTRYDLAIERERRLGLVQCKTGRLKRGVVEFRVASSYYHQPNPSVPSKHYRGQIDYFAVYCPDNGAVYLVPIDDVPGNRWASLRVTPALNGQSRRVRPADRYEIGTVAISASTREPNPRTCS